MNLENYNEVLNKRERLYKSYISLALIFWGIGNFLLKDQARINDSALGFINGLTLGIEIICVFWVFRIRKALKDDKILRKLYIDEHDERKNFIKLKAGYNLIGKIALGIFVISILASYFNMVIFYTLVITGIFLIILSLLLKLYWIKKI
ncbi:Uncharacterised protein [Anaerococcus prevotii]|uniref:DUF3278 domain-containing protein n=1 Tax=Anaerococcus prevotii (strain ATCC 9321 / DSM 20548 / JCM 6508 / NCTC 11806 / PC1) TaxID=525919 RepID=C7RH05_ANAPD|nr:hypothetical protein [Anaerococcus prevotii]ACV28766.1 hypothetical protein Apre_0738 [Anaerococcus prevotii DSM 20548]SUU94441.1 Uncharacterised protein [Anaerococcus prevotii]